MGILHHRMNTSSTIHRVCPIVSKGITAKINLGSIEKSSADNLDITPRSSLEGRPTKLKPCAFDQPRNMEHGTILPSGECGYPTDSLGKSFGRLSGLKREQFSVWLTFPQPDTRCETSRVTSQVCELLTALSPCKRLYTGFKLELTHAT